jgi:tyrosinase
VAVKVRNQNPEQGGQVVFFATIPGTGQAELPLMLPTDGAPVDCHIAGQFQRPSIEDGDAAIEVVDAATSQVLGTAPLMVRIRKDATTLTAAERNLFLETFAIFNDRGRGSFSNFRNVHTDAGDREAHRRPGVPPLASGLSAGSGAGAAEDSPRRRPSLLALRSAGAKRLHQGLHGRGRSNHRQGAVQP